MVLLARDDYKIDATDDNCSDSDDQNDTTELSVVDVKCDLLDEFTSVFPEPDAGHNEDGEEDCFAVARMRTSRSQSLRGEDFVKPRDRRSSGEKKMVRFADAMGLELQTIHYIAKDDSCKSLNARRNGVRRLCQTADDHTSYQFRFVLPSTEPDFEDKIKYYKVILNSCAAGKNAVSGTVRVANVAFEKAVHVRYTINNWLTHQDEAATYVQFSNDKTTDTFAFAFHVPRYFTRGCRLQFAIRYRAGGQEFWDNNFGHNYIIEIS